MYTENGSIVIERVVRFSVHEKCTSAVDITESNFVIPNSELVRLYEVLKLTVERQGRDWSKYCDNLFEKE